MTTDRKTQLKQSRERRYVARDFDSFRATILDYARQYFPDKIQDFSESSVGGLFMDMAAYVGDNMSFYLDHLYNELHFETAVEPVSIERAIVNSGVMINGAAPATVDVTVYIEVPVAELDDDEPDISLLPIIKADSVFFSQNSVSFNLLEDIEFLVDSGDGNYILNPKVQKKIGNTNTSGQVTSYVLSLSGLCVSGTTATDTFNIGEFIPFRNLT